MYANFTEETCTGTGATIALAGATTGNIPFSASFSDGDLVAYVVEDSGGTIKVAGIGTYVSATDDITRNDTWNWNGTVIDNNPSTNITLSGGTHTVRCDAMSLYLPSHNVGTYLPNSNFIDVPDNFSGSFNTANAWTADECIYASISLLRPRVITNLVCEVVAADGAATLSKAGIYTVGTDGKPDNLLGSVTVDVTTTGIKTVALSSPIALPAGAYYTAFASDGTPTMRNYNAPNEPIVGGSTLGFNITVPRRYHVSENLTGWSDLPSAPNPAAFVENYPAFIGWT